VCLFLFLLIGLYSSAGCFELDSIAQQKATGTAKGDLRASQGGLYPPWSLMLSHILARGCFSFEVVHWVTRCERRGLKNPQMCFIQGRRSRPSLFFNDGDSLQAGQIDGPWKLGLQKVVKTVRQIEMSSPEMSSPDVPIVEMSKSQNPRFVGVIRSVGTGGS
jgi:hypothetical protein